MLTKEKLLDLTGFKKIGTDDALRGVGVIFGYPVEAVVFHTITTLTLAFTTAETVNTKTHKRLRDTLWENQALRDKVDVWNLKDDGVPTCKFC